jgi:hypothetical protein
MKEAVRDFRVQAAARSANRGRLAERTTLIAHVLKWVHQPERRSGIWRATILEQRDELEDLVGQGVLRNHAEAVLAEVYRKAVERATAETGLATETFPVVCPYTIDHLLAADLLAE